MNESLSKKQLICICSNFLLSSSLIILTGLKYAKRDTFICDTLGFLAGFLLHSMMYYVVSKFPNMEFTQILDYIFTSIGGRMIALFYLFFSISLLCLVQGNVTEVVRTIIMPKTPIWAIALSLLLIAGYAMKLGIYKLGLNIEMMFPFIFCIISVIYIILFIKFVDLENLLPIFTENVTSVSKGFLDVLGFPYADSCILIFIYSLTKEKPKNLKIIKIIFFIASFLLILRSEIAIASLSINNADDLLFPLFKSLTLVEFGDYIVKLDIWLLMVWSISTYFKLAICYYVALKCIEYIFKLNDYKKISLAFALFILPFSLNTFTKAEDNYLNVMVSMPVIKIPIMLLTILIFIKTFFLVHKGNEIDQ